MGRDGMRGMGLVKNLLKRVEEKRKRKWGKEAESSREKKKK